MRSNYVCFMLMTITMIAIFMVIGIETQDSEGEVNNGPVTINYDPSTGLLSYSGSSDSDLINVVVYGYQYVSVISATVVQNGSFSDTLYLGDLADGTYEVKFTGRAYNEIATFQVGYNPITINALEYDLNAGLLIFSGSSSLDIVNIRVYGLDYESQLDACIVSSGQFSDTFYLGHLSPGVYTVEFSNNETYFADTFTVGGDMITIMSMSFDDGILSYEGRASVDLVNVVVYGYEYVSSVNATIVSAGSFQDIFYLGDLKAGTYTVKFTGKGCSIEEQFSKNASDPNDANSIYSEDGRILIEYNGTTDDYLLPSSVEIVSEGAFDKASIKRFVLTKDVVWNIKIKNNVFPLQSAGVTDVVIQEGVTQIPDYLFAGTKITSLLIPSSVQSIGSKSFYLCRSLENIIVADNNHLETIGTYAFGSNPNLTNIVIGNSETGYSCSIDTGCFYKCDTITMRLDSDFNLYSIGNGAFAAVNVKMLIDDEVGDMIHIPGSVGNIGMNAFSGDVVDSMSVNEPGKNTLRFSGEVNITRYGNNGETGRSIIFEDNNNLTMLAFGCFSYTNPVDLIDLGGCNQLTTIDAMAFAYCLDNVSGNNLVLPTQIQTIGEAAFEGRGQRLAPEGSVLELPKGLEHLEKNAFAGLCKTIMFDAGSKLRFVEGSSSAPFELIDLSNCLELEEFGSYCSNVKLPPGVFRGSCSDVHEDTPLAIVRETGGAKALVIGSNTTAILTNQLVGLDQILVDESNPYFEWDAGALYQNNDSKKLLFTLGLKEYIVDSNCSQIISVAFGAGVEILRFDNPDVIIKDSIVTNASDLRSVYISEVPGAWSMPSAFEGMVEGVTFYITNEMDYKDIAFLKKLGTVFVGYNLGNRTVYLPEDYEGKTISYTDLTIEDSALSARICIEGQIPTSIDMIAIGANVKYDDGIVTIQNIAGDEAFLRLFGELTYSDTKVSVTFIGNGGLTDAGEEKVIISVHEGSVIGPNSFPQFKKALADLIGWSSEDGSGFTSRTKVNGDMVVMAEWADRTPIIYIDTTNATIFANGKEIRSVNIESSGTIEFSAVPKEGYELGDWILNGESKGSAHNSIIVMDLTEDSYLSITGTYYAPSTGSDSVFNHGMPTDEEVEKIVHAYTIGGYVRTTGSVWSGMASIPLIVDDYLYVRIAGKIYKAESDTGYIVKSADSTHLETFYHSLGYGGGYIIDYNSSKVFDTDLNQLYILEKGIESAYYHEGKFYILGKQMYSFNPEDEDTSKSDEVKSFEYMGKYDDLYGSYGVYSHVFVGDYVYCITAKGDARGLIAINLLTGESNCKWLDGIHAMYLDDGWLSYYEGYLFITAYSTGLFGAVATAHSDRVSYLSVNGIDFGTESWFEFEESTFSSRFAFCEDRAFVVMGGTLYVFDLPDDIADLDFSKLAPRKTRLDCGHGNFVIDTSHIDEEGSPVYAYGIPYDTHYFETMWIAVDKMVDGEYKASSVPLYSTEREWNSQAIRSDIDGRMIWYNDSGWLYSYTTSNKNVYYFFIEDGTSAKWYEAYGRSAADALESLGSEVATMNAAKVIQSINGHSISSGLVLQMLKPTYGTTDNNGQYNNIDQYTWQTIDNLGDSSYSLNHYFRIICGDGVAVSSGDVFTYIDGNEKKTYNFADNIGDRNIIGKLLSRGTSSETILLRFVDENDVEIPGTLSVVKNGSSAKIHFPEVSRVGYVPVWKDSLNNGSEVSDVYGTVFTSNASFYLTWEPLPPGYLVTGAMETVNDTTAWSADVIIKSGVGSVADLQVKVTAITSDGRVLSEMKVTAADGKASGTFETADVALIYIRIVDEHVEGNLGYAMIEREAHP